MKGTFECSKVKAGLLPTRVEPRKKILSSLMVKDLFLFKSISDLLKGGKSPKWAFTGSLRMEMSDLKLPSVLTERR